MNNMNKFLYLFFLPIVLTSCVGNYVQKSGQISEKFVPLKRPFDLRNGKVGIACRSELNGGEESVYQAIKNGGLKKRVEFIERTEGLEEDYNFLIIKDKFN